MNTNDRAIILLAGVAVMSSLAGIARSQAIALAAAPSLSPDGATDGTQLEAVVVTAQRRTENAQTVPVTVDSVGSIELAQANITLGTQLAKVVPALEISPNSQTITVFLRGIGSNVTAPGAEASVAVYVDGVYWSRLTPALMQLNNIDRVEVLKGPQGTLYGRNATGGLVNIITHDPQVGAAPEYKLSLGYGNYDTSNESGYASFSLGDHAAMDVAVVAQTQGKGWGSNIYNGEEYQKNDDHAVRTKLVIEPFEGTRIKLTGEAYGYTGNANQPVPYNHEKQGNYDGSGLVAAPPGFFDTDTLTRNLGTAHIYAGSLRIEQDLPFAMLSDTAAYHHAYETNDVDSSFLPPVAGIPLEPVYLWSIDKELENDLLLSSLPGSLFDWNFGAFFMDFQSGYQPADIGGAAIAASGVPQGTQIQYSSLVRTESAALYGQAHFPIVANLKGTVGARYTTDKLTGHGSSDLLFPGLTSLTLPNVPPSSSRFDKVTWRGGLDYEFTPDWFSYASASRAFKGATLNTIPFDGVPTKPEVLTAYELGIRSELLDHRVRISGALFHYNLKDPQVIVIPASNAITVENAGAAKVDGGELEAKVVVLKGLNLRTAVTYLHARYTDYPNAAFYAVNPNPPLYGNDSAVKASANGKALPYAPRVAFNVGGDYSFGLPNGGTITLNTNIAYTSTQYFQPDNVPKQAGYTLVDASASYQIPNTSLSVKAWGANITNKLYYTGAIELGDSAGDQGFPGQPRTYGLTVNYGF